MKPRSKKTAATYTAADAKAADAAAGAVKFRRGRPPKPFDWSTVTPEARAAAIAEWQKKKT